MKDTVNSDIVKVMSEDEKEFMIERKHAIKSITIKNLLDDVEKVSETPIPLPNVKADVLQIVIEFLKHEEVQQIKKAPTDEKTEKTARDEEQANHGADWDKFKDWELKFIGKYFMTSFEKKEFGLGEHQRLLFATILAANYLDVKQLLDLTCRSVANQIKGKTPDQIRETFKIVNDISPEEAEKYKKENELLQD